MEATTYTKLKKRKAALKIPLFCPGGEFGAPKNCGGSPAVRCVRSQNTYLVLAYLGELENKTKLAGCFGGTACLLLGVIGPDPPRQPCAVETWGVTYAHPVLEVSTHLCRASGHSCWGPPMLQTVPHSPCFTESGWGGGGRGGSTFLNHGIWGVFFLSFCFNFLSN